jgi:hypothetical protein
LVINKKQLSTIFEAELINLFNFHINRIMNMLKEVAFIAGKSENQAAKIFFIPFFNNNLIANISLYALSWPKLNFGCYLTFEIIF